MLTIPDTMVDLSGDKVTIPDTMVDLSGDNADHARYYGGSIW